MSKNTQPIVDLRSIASGKSISTSEQPDIMEQLSFLKRTPDQIHQSIQDNLNLILDSAKEHGDSDPDNPFQKGRAAYNMSIAKPNSEFASNLSHLFYANDEFYDIAASFTPKQEASVDSLRAPQINQKYNEVITSQIYAAEHQAFAAGMIDQAIQVSDIKTALIVLRACGGLQEHQPTINSVLNALNEQITSNPDFVAVSIPKLCHSDDHHGANLLRPFVADLQGNYRFPETAPIDLVSKISEAQHYLQEAVQQCKDGQLAVNGAFNVLQSKLVDSMSFDEARVNPNFRREFNQTWYDVKPSSPEAAYALGEKLSGFMQSECFSKLTPTSQEKCKIMLFGFALEQIKILTDGQSSSVDTPISVIVSELKTLKMIIPKSLPESPLQNISTTILFQSVKNLSDNRPGIGQKLQTNTI